MSLDLTKQLIATFKKAVNSYNQLEQTTLKFGTKYELHPAEIDTIELIAQNENCNLITLAKISGVTRGTTSKMVRRLVDKRMVIKEYAPDSEKEYILQLTHQGKIAQSNHQKYVNEIDEQISVIFADLPDSVLKEILAKSNEAAKLLKQIADKR
ncbi:MarR family transcriptional regulator [Lactobacillus sp. ESL0731]|uniref:MarR family winged helix-turn-helix transcriptional regulator n=1 Tax=unclassified Lactobacillus TaxID=2620435 RepID=UPI0023FA06EB|nr:MULTISPECIES: MarR family transcriptional regulator [unclassified Lactobacillus]WEV51169.1 MarR family transcriptional regulator [Lactobacillus sp. ESL0700]WEV62299.1 MarR family transcriptional regulator [Lactobacillus sp. ESL0731]